MHPYTKTKLLLGSLRRAKRELRAELRRNPESGVGELQAGAHGAQCDIGRKSTCQGPSPVI